MSSNTPHSTQYCILLQEAFEWFACHEAEKLYKSEAIDSFGNRYLLGVFENKAEAEKAFDAWNKEYEQAWVLGLWTFCKHSGNHSSKTIHV
jgi:hypothetical protein